MGARKLVFRLLMKMDKSDSYSNILLDNALEQTKLSPKDRAFASALFYGVIERRLTLDFLIRAYSATEFDDISAEAVQILRMGLYQLAYMDSIPESAAVNESVNLAVYCKKPNLKGFINAILRTYIRKGKRLDTSGLDELMALSVQYSCPRWLVKMWVNDFGMETAVSILKSTLGRPPLYFRANTQRFKPDEVLKLLEKDGFKAKKSAFLPACIEIEKAVPIEGSRAYSKGAFHVQDISSQVCCQLLNPIFNETVIDICAAPGGKSFTIAELMGNRGKVLSFDLHEHKAKLIDDGANRLGLTIISSEINDATSFNPKIPLADKVLCDVPCSGLGVIRRKPEIKYKPHTFLNDFPPLQLEILRNTARYVKPGGTLVYSTCTLNKAENSGVVETFLAENSDFCPIVVHTSLPLKENGYMRAIIPGEIGGDGFFIATLRRKTNTE